MNIKDAIWLKLMKLGRLYGCHQRADRSFFVGKYQMPVCARCTGVIATSVLALVRKSKMNLFQCILLCMPMIVDGSIQYVKIKESNNIRRLITGLFAGYGLMTMYILIIKKFICKSSIK